MASRTFYPDDIVGERVNPSAGLASPCYQYPDKDDLVWVLTKEYGPMWVQPSTMTWHAVSTLTMSDMMYRCEIGSMQRALWQFEEHIDVGL